MKVLSRRIGHADAAFTPTQYVQTDPEADNRDANALAELIISGSLAPAGVTDMAGDGGTDELRERPPSASYPQRPGLRGRGRDRRDDRGDRGDDRGDRGDDRQGVPRQADAGAGRAERRASRLGRGQYQAPASFPASGCWLSHCA